MSNTLERKTFSVKIGYDPQSGNVLSENWENQFGQFDRMGDLPAVIKYCPRHGTPIYQRWHSGDGNHREGNKAAVIVTDSDTGVLLVENFALLGHLHREGDRPARTKRTKDGTLIEVSYWKFGKQHRDPQLGPAVLHYHPDSGEIKEVEYWVNDMKVNPSSKGPILDI